jgi:hypothetical protein
MKKEFVCDLHYLHGVLSGTPWHRWALAIGFVDGTPWGIDCLSFSAKPTKKQLREIKRKYR